MTRRELMSVAVGILPSVGAAALIQAIPSQATLPNQLLGTVGVALIFAGVAVALYLIKTNPAPARRPRPDIDVRVALGWIDMRELRPLQIDQVEAVRRYEAAELAFRQAASDGAIHVWGYRANRDILEEIPAVFWLDHWLDGTTVLYPEDEVDVSTTSAKVPDTRYRALRVDKAEVQFEWPKPV